MTKMKLGPHCVNFIDHDGDYGAYLQLIMAYLVVHYGLPSYFICHFSDDTFTLFSSFRECASMF